MLDPKGWAEKLPRNVTITRTRQIGPRRQSKGKIQKDGRILGNIRNLAARALTSTGLQKRRIGVGAKALISEFGKKLVDEAIKHAPELYKFGTSKIKNKIFKRALESDIANYIFKEAKKKAVENLFG